MTRRQIVLGVLLFIAVALYCWILFVEIPSKREAGNEKLRQDPLTHQFEDVLSFKNEYVGNASNSGNLFQALPLNKYKNGIEIKPEEWKLIVYYNVTAEELGEKAEQSVLYNAAAAFALIGNLEVLDMQFTDRSYTMTREELEETFSVPLDELADSASFKEQVQDRLTALTGG